MRQILFLSQVISKSRNAILNFLSGLLIFLCVSSCVTYQVPLESLKLQFTGIDSSKLVTITSITRQGDEYTFLINPIKVLKCLDNDNNPMIIRTNPRLMIIVTDKNNNKTKLGFDRVLLNNEYLYGQSLFMPEVIKAIPLEDIVKIQVRDERRKFEYGNMEIQINK
jgi:hypothetical protein